MIQCDDNTRAVVKDYFGKDVEVLAIRGMSEIPEDIEKRDIMAIFFERNLLGSPKTRPILNELRESLPETKLIGLSSYLTLALAKATEGPEDLTNFLTQPVSPEDLAGIFEGEQVPSVANAYKD